MYPAKMNWPMAQSMARTLAVMTNPRLTNAHAKHKSRMTTMSPKNHVNQNPSSDKINDRTDKV